MGRKQATRPPSVQAKRYGQDTLAKEGTKRERIQEDSKAENEEKVDGKAVEGT